MGLLNLKQKSAVKFIKNQETVSVKGQKVMPDGILRVGVLADYGLIESYDFSRRLAEVLKIERTQLQMMLYLPSGKNRSYEDYQSFSEEAFGMFGKIKSEEVKKFAATKFDLLINYCESESVFGQVLFIRSNAKLKAGFDNEGSSFNDISIKVAGNKIDLFNEELARYLELLNLIG